MLREISVNCDVNVLERFNVLSTDLCLWLFGTCVPTSDSIKRRFFEESNNWQFLCQCFTAWSFILNKIHIHISNDIILF
jgi:hypothetical protein